jgi:molybdopterin converting factor small subunit
MKVSIEFFGIQRNYTNTYGIEMSIDEKTKVSDVVEYIRHNYPGLPMDHGSVHVIVNQEIASLDRMLQANDTIAFLPSIHGG